LFSYGLYTTAFDNVRDEEHWLKEMKRMWRNSTHDGRRRWVSNNVLGVQKTNQARKEAQINRPNPWSVHYFVTTCEQNTYKKRHVIYVGARFSHNARRICFPVENMHAW